MGPYKDKYRYWTGLLLLVRVVLFIMFSSIANTNALESGSINLFIVNLVSCFLLAATTTFKPYKKKINNITESCYLLNLVLLSSSSLYISDSSSNQVYAYSILVGVAFLGFLMATGYHIYLKIPTKKCHTSESPPSSQADERFELMREEEKEEGEDFNTDSTVFNLSLEPSLK